MTSGLYAALSGAVSKMEIVDIVGNNLSNISTLGYKKDRIQFSAMLNDAQQTQQTAGVNYTYVGEVQTVYSQGMTVDTRNDYDVAISGEGFFKIRDDEGIYYTRLGGFDRGQGGELVTRTGAQVLSADNKPIIVPEGPIMIDEKGRILGEEGEVGQIALMNPDTSKLIKEGLGRYRYDGDEREVQPGIDSQILQGHLEQSNVNAMEETTLMMTSLRAFESYQKAMKNYLDLESKINDIGIL
ncbi:MAG: hypothetical protein C0620_11420 [Desulfuromonas sp.]|nr:MAG: hypothetical protein C0620_11420 [Desulfuromonas sp.]